MSDRQLLQTHLSGGLVHWSCPQDQAVWPRHPLVRGHPLGGRRGQEEVLHGEAAPEGQGGEHHHLVHHPHREHGRGGQEAGHLQSHVRHQLPTAWRSNNSD